MIGKDKIVFDPSESGDTDNIGAYVRAGTDGTLISSTTVSGKEGLDVYVLNPSLEVTQGTSPWVIGDGGGSITVDAIDFDIRDLNYANDSVSIFGAGGNQLVVNADGSLNVNADISVVNGHEKAEDSAHANADIGSYVLSVRQDALASSTSADGDYQSFKTDSVGALWVKHSGDVNLACDDQFANAAVSVGVVATVITASLAVRRRIIVQNADGSKPIYVGDSSVTTGTGLRLTAGAALEIELAASATLYAIAGAANAQVRVFETGHA